MNVAEALGVIFLGIIVLIACAWSSGTLKVKFGWLNEKREKLKMSFSSSTVYRAMRNHCDCHPETCCCSRYKVVKILDGKESFYCKADDWNNALDIAEGLNMLNDARTKSLEDTL